MPKSSSWVYIPGANVGLGASQRESRRFTPTSSSFPFQSLGPPKVPLDIPWTDPSNTKGTCVSTRNKDGLTRVSVQPNMQFRPELFPPTEEQAMTRPVDVQVVASKEAEELIAAMYAGLSKATAPQHRYKVPLDTAQREGAKMRLSTRPISSKSWSPEREVFAAQVIQREVKATRTKEENSKSSRTSRARGAPQHVTSSSAPHAASFAAWIPSGSKFFAKQEAKIRQKQADPACEFKATNENMCHSTRTKHNVYTTMHSMEPDNEEDECEVQEKDSSSRIVVAGLNRPPLPPLPPAFDSLALKDRLLSREEDHKEALGLPTAPLEELTDEESARELEDSMSELILPPIESPIIIPSSIEHISPSKSLQAAAEEEEDNDLDICPPAQPSIIIVHSPQPTPSRKVKNSPAKQPPSPSVIVVTHSPGKAYISDSLKTVHQPRIVEQVPVIAQEDDDGPDVIPDSPPKFTLPARATKAAEHPPLEHYSKIFAELMELDPLLWPSPRPIAPSPEKAIQTDEPVSPSSSSASIDSITDLAELEALVEKQHRQLIARGLLPPEAKIKIPQSPSSIISGDSWASYQIGLKRLAGEKAAGFSYH